MRDKEKKRNRLRIFIVLGLFYLALGAVTVRTYRLQILDADYYKGLARDQYLKKTTLRYPRGVIYARNFEELAVARKSYSVYAHPQMVKNPQAVARRLSRILETNPSEIERKLRDKSSFVWIARSISEEQGEALKALLPSKTKKGEKPKPNFLPGIVVQEDEGRYYPGQELAGPVLGFAGVDGQGLEGVEHYYDEMLKGKPIEILVEKDARQEIRVFVDEEDSEDKPSSLVLTIDLALQYLAEQKLKDTVNKFSARRGLLLAMEPDSGAILAMAQYPSFNPNNWYAYHPQERRNWAITDIYEPGSTFKVFVLASALEEKKVRLDEIINCENGAYVVNGDTINDIKGYDKLTVPEVLAHSSNIGMAKIAERLGPELLYKHIMQFGFGSRTGIDFPGEAKGMVRPYQKWPPITLRTIGFGQGISVTPIQLLSALCAIANGGELLKPYLAEKLILADGSERILNRRTVVARVLSKETAEQMKKLMTEVVNYGTGKLAQIPGYQVAGKTGTAQKPAPREEGGGYYLDKWVCSFMGFVPADQPKIAMLVIIDEPKASRATGGMIAAPVFQELAKYVLTRSGELPQASFVSELKTLLPSNRGLEQIYPPSPQSNREPGIVPNFKGMALFDALKLGFSMGYNVMIEGSGWVKEQSPAPGEQFKDKIVLRLSEER